MLDQNSDKIREEIISKALFIFNTVFTDEKTVEVEGSKNGEEQLKESESSEPSNQGKTSEATYTLYIEELLSQEKLGGFVKKICEEHQSNQALQDAKEELVNLLEELETLEAGRRNLDPPSVSSKYATESVYTAPRQDRTSTPNDREIPNDFDEAEPQFTFHRLIEEFKQFFCTLTDETERSRFTAKQFIGFIITALGAIVVALGLGTDKRG